MPQGSFTAACIQVNASEHMDDNLATAARLAREAAGAGAELIAFPENVSMMEFGGRNIRTKAYEQDAHPGVEHFRGLARDLEAWLLVGSLSVSLPATNKVANRSFMISSKGDIVDTYDKIHMFDVDLDGGESYRESNTFEAGNRAVTVDLPWAKLGMSVCYDVRFPHLYQSYAQAGASILSVPAAFTRQTGEAHWHTLLRARAIETGSYVIAPGQCGSHKGDRETFGHSLIVDPWGKVLADGGTEPGFIIAEIDPAQSAAARSKIPNLQHNRDYVLG